MKKIVLFLVVLCVFSIAKVNSQGCSDAGFCTVDALKPVGTSEEEGWQNQLKFGVNIGEADNAISTFGQYIEYKRLFSEKISFNAKVTGLSQSGNDISNFGLADVYINGNYAVNKKTSITAGFKIPLTDGNDLKNGVSLPMDYQSSLGTLDLILGVTYKLNNFNLALGYQQPLTQNKNQFFSTNSSLGFFNTNNYKRSGDVLLRISYPYEVTKKFKITPSLLPIYHLSEDKVTINNVEQVIKGSNGLTLNANAYFDYEINSKNALLLSFGTPFVVRDARPDGLTRKFVVNLEYRIRFSNTKNKKADL